MAQRKIVVLGGALAGPWAAARARETDDRAKITLVTRGRAVSYAVGGLPYFLSREVSEPGELNKQRAAFFRNYYGVDVQTGVDVKGIDPEKRRVSTSAGSLSYDALVYALGARSLVPEIVSGASNLSTLRTLPDLKKIDRLIKRKDAAVTIIGGGYYGVEAADCLARRGCRVTLVEKSPLLLSDFSPDASRLAAEALRKIGVDVRNGATIEAVKRKGRAITALNIDGDHVATKLVVVTSGVTPRTEIFSEAGGRLHRDGTIKVDDRCETNLPGVFATSICVSHKHAVTKKPVWTAQAADADKSAQVAGENAAGGSAKLAPTLGTSIVRAGSLTLARTGLTRGDAVRERETARVYGRSRDDFFPGSAELTITLSFDGRTRRVIGAEVLGEDGVDKRIDVLATAITGKLKVDQVAQLDLAYSPPYGTVRDPINAVGTIARQSEDVRAWAPVELMIKTSDTLVWDVRTPKQRKAHPFAATAVSLKKLREKKRELKKAKMVVFLSEDGREGYLAARIAKGLGCPDAGYLSGGLRAWREAEF